MTDVIPHLTLGNLMIDCADPERARDFYAELLGEAKTVEYGFPTLIAQGGLTLLFAPTDLPYVPPVWPEEPGQPQKQMHLDITVDDLPAAVESALRLGATRPDMQYGGDWHVTLLDTEGHPFCLCRRQRDSEFERYFRAKGYESIPNPSLNIDCHDTRTLRRFYEQLTEWDRDFHWSALIADHGLVVHFMGCDGDFEYEPPVWPEAPGAQQKQMHLDLQVDDLPRAVEEALRLGATRADEQFGGARFVTLLDPEGHPFCLCARA